MWRPVKTLWAQWQQRFQGSVLHPGLVGRIRLVLLGGLGVLVTGCAVWLGIAVFAPGPHQTDRIVYIPKGVGLVAVSKELREANILRSEPVFRRGLLWLGLAQRLRAGEYRIPARMSMFATAQLLLKTGTPVLHPVQLVEGLTSWQIVEALRANPLLSGPITDIPPEGSLLPETYFIERGSARTALVARMRSAMDELVADVWARRPDDFLLRSPEELVIMASLVEKETGLEEERNLISAVFLERLRRRMRLQSDPTVIYGLTNGKTLFARPISLSDLATYTPYNTYRKYGLPPTPIANPGRASLESVIAPAKTSYLYFVADGKGGHLFATNLRAHNRNVAKWRRLRLQGSSGRP